MPVVSPNSSHSPTRLLSAEQNRAGFSLFFFLKRNRLLISLFHVKASFSFFLTLGHAEAWNRASLTCQCVANHRQKTRPQKGSGAEHGCLPSALRFTMLSPLFVFKGN